MSIAHHTARNATGLLGTTTKLKSLFVLMSCTLPLDGWEGLRTGLKYYTPLKKTLFCSVKVHTFAIRWLASVAKLRRLGNNTFYR